MLSQHPVRTSAAILRHHEDGPPAYKTDRASTRTYENLIFYEVLTDGQQYDAARLSLIASNIRKNTDVKYTALFIEYKEYGSAPSYAATSMNGDSVAEIRGRDSKRTGNRCASGRFFGRFPERAGAKDRNGRQTQAAVRLGRQNGTGPFQGSVFQRLYRLRTRRQTLSRQCFRGRFPQLAGVGSSDEERRQNISCGGFPG